MENENTIICEYHRRCGFRECWHRKPHPKIISHNGDTCTQIHNGYQNCKENSVCISIFEDKMRKAIEKQDRKMK